MLHIVLQNEKKNYTFKIHVEREIFYEGYI